MNAELEIHFDLWNSQKNGKRVVYHYHGYYFEKPMKVAKMSLHHLYFIATHFEKYYLYILFHKQ